MSRDRAASFKLHYWVTILFLIIPTYCLITKKELFPFAPYTMYSYPMFRAPHREIVIELKAGDNVVPTERKRLYPWDQARLREFIFKKLEASERDTLKNVFVDLIHRSKDLTSIRVVEQKWKHFRVSNLRHPDREITLLEVFR